MASLFGIGLLLLSSLAWSGSILVMGDSLSAAYGIPVKQGWVTLLEQRLAQTHPDYDVVNASISGETTHGGLTRLPAVLDQYQPTLVILELGANDGLQGAPLKVIENNLNQLVSQAQATGASVLLLEMRIPPNYGPRYSDGFTGLFSRVAAQHEIPLVPFFMASIALQPELMQADGLHPKAAAQPALLDQVWPVLESLLAPPSSAG
ncbi:arylesterase [Amphritea sp. 2_MG-2023]|uniref:arylesterase n=1 Tax=Amphritea TaxID=515417 RepID=UPI001C07144C|nr:MULTISPECIES: arylesterase [Amphritea]MBU2967127.1 arylesterase [Amphritea atlantica]MDO6419320.1 arylesterase [Amphritea sp. 2_MG-2023]MDX2421233.1 arylesterase [Amphritea sp.]